MDFSPRDLLAPIASVIVAVISAIFGTRYHRQQQDALAKNDQARIQDEHLERVIDSYVKISDELREEIRRLEGKVDSLQAQNDACEARNESLKDEVEELKARMVALESGK